MIIALEFDGVIVEDAFPRIGEEKPFAFDTLKKLRKRGHTLILWSRRTGKSLDEAVEFCRQNGMEFYAVNKSYPEEELDNDVSRKVNAELFIDNRMQTDLPDWGAIYQMIKRNKVYQPFSSLTEEVPAPGLFSRILKTFSFQLT